MRLIQHLLFGLIVGQELVTQCQQEARDAARREIKVWPKFEIKNNGKK